MNKLIFGKDDTQGIVNITCVDELVYIYRLVDGQIECEVDEHIPYALTKDEYEMSTRLRGHNYYKYKTPIIEENYEDVRGRGIYKPRSKEEGYMLASGATYFKGLKPDQLSYLSFDIETTSLSFLDPKANVVLLSSTYRDRAGVWKRKLWDIHDFKDCVELIKDWCKFVREFDPDIVLAHNVFGFDLEYLDSFAPLNLGRDGSQVKFDKKVSKKRKDGSQSYDYYNCRIHGREIVDTMFLSITYDVERNFPSYGLKNIEKHLDLVDSSRIEWDFNKNPVSEVVTMGGQLWQDFRDYCQADADSPIKMFDIMAPSLFYLTQSIPKTFQQMVNEATGSQIDSFMIRAYLQDGWSQPMTTQKKDFQGAISAGIPGIYENVRKVDVASLYPSIMLQYEYYPRSKDKEKYYLKALDYFTTERFKNKKLFEQTGDKYYNDLQAAMKIFINSTYGAMGANYLIYNEPRDADKVTEKGREILQQGVKYFTGHEMKHVIKKIVKKGKPDEKIIYEWVVGDKVAEGRGYTLANVDTDSCSITNGIAPTKEEFAQEIAEFNDTFDKRINWADDGVFQKVIVNKAKNYILQKHPDWCKPKDFDANGVPKLVYKGSSFKDQKKEPFLKGFLHELIDNLWDGHPENITHCYDAFCNEALSITDINLWAVKKTVTKAVLKETTPAGANINNAIKGKGFREGDKAWLYCTEHPDHPGNAMKMKYKLISEYNNDEHKWHYVRRVYSTLNILENLVDIKSITKYHNKTQRHLLVETCAPSEIVV